MTASDQRFKLDLDVDETRPNMLPENQLDNDEAVFTIGEIKEKDFEEKLPPPPTFKATKSGFPEHKSRFKSSVSKQRQNIQANSSATVANAPSSSNDSPQTMTRVLSSDQAIVNHLGKKYGVDFESQQRKDISRENRQKIAQMTDADIEEARAELMANLDPALIRRLLMKASIDDEQESLQEKDKGNSQNVAEGFQAPERYEEPPKPILHAENSVLETAPPMHFPTPPRSADSYIPLDPDDPNFLADLKKQYFPELLQDPSALSWMQDITTQDVEESAYNPSRSSYSPSSLRFSFRGTLIPPKEALKIEVSEGLHHHGDDAASAGYTIPELTLLARSTLPNQRSVAYQVLGRILYRLGRGDFGDRGSDLQESLWALIEHERPIEILMAEANRASGHVTAKAYATEALWLWKKGGGDRGVLKEGEKLAK